MDASTTETLSFQGMMGVGFIAAAACMWGMLGPLSKMALAEGVSPLEIAFWRAALGAMMFGTHAAATGRVRVEKKDVLPMLGFGFVSVSVFYGSYQIAIDQVGAALSAILLYTAPAWVGMLSYLVLRERLSSERVITICITIIGAVMVCLPDSAAGISPSAFGVAAGLTAGFSYALYYIFGRKLLDAYPACTVFFYSLLAGALLLAPSVDFAPKNATAWGFLFTIAAIASYGAFSAYSAGLRRLESTKAVIIATLEPVVAVGISCTFFNESLSYIGWIGCILIIVAVLYVGLSERNK
jgi:drug/metabolite transporter (DMT)-like permease